MKGAFGATIDFRVPGGDLGRYRSIVVGAPQFAVGDQVVVFLGASGPMVPFVVGFNQGVYRIATNSSAEPVVTPPPLLPSAQAQAVVRGDAARRPMPLADFEARVVALVRSAQ